MQMKVMMLMKRRLLKGKMSFKFNTVFIFKIQDDGEYANKNDNVHEEKVIERKDEL